MDGESGDCSQSGKEIKMLERWTVKQIVLWVLVPIVLAFVLGAFAMEARRTSHSASQKAPMVKKLK